MAAVPANFAGPDDDRFPSSRANGTACFVIIVVIAAVLPSFFVLKTYDAAAEACDPPLEPDHSGAGGSRSTPGSAIVVQKPWRNPCGGRTTAERQHLTILVSKRPRQ